MPTDSNSSNGRGEHSSSVVEAVYRRVSRRLPDRLAALLDWHLFPDPLRPFKEVGPFNGQRGRVRIFLQILERLQVEAIVETGTYRGATSLFMRHASGLTVYTADVNARNLYFARRRFGHDAGIHTYQGDSRSFLKGLGADPRMTSGIVFFYLDAHHPGSLPLCDEVMIIAGSWSEPVIMIDDFQVPDDPDYKFDDYGSGRRLTVDYLPESFRRDFRLFWPRLRGEAESGHRRGYVVAARRGSVGEGLAGLSLVRENETVYPRLEGI